MTHMTHQVTAAEYRRLQHMYSKQCGYGEWVEQNYPGSTVKVTGPALARLQRNAADPVKARARKAPLGRECDVLRAITDYLSVELGPEGRGWFRMNADEAEREGRRIRMAPEATADLLAIIPNWRRFVQDNGIGVQRDVATIFWIEVKRPGGRTNRARAAKQREFRQYMQTIGCVAIEARSLEDVTAVLPPRGRRC